MEYDNESQEFIDDASAQNEITEINIEYADNLTRSDEEGWFYPDEDGQGEA